MIAIACSFAPSATVQAGASSWSSAPPNDVARLAGTARLFVWRAADFGTEIYLVLYIDGACVTILGRNEATKRLCAEGSMSSPSEQLRAHMERPNLRPAALM